MGLATDETLVTLETAIAPRELDGMKAIDNVRVPALVLRLLSILSLLRVRIFMFGGAKAREATM